MNPKQFACNVGYFVPEDITPLPTAYEAPVIEVEKGDNNGYLVSKYFHTGLTLERQGENASNGCVSILECGEKKLVYINTGSKEQAPSLCVNNRKYVFKHIIR